MLRKKNVFKILQKKCIYLITDNFRIEFICEICLKSYKYKRGLQTHQKFECENKGQFKCEKCDRHFNHKQDMKRHLNICKFEE